MLWFPLFLPSNTTCNGMRLQWCTIAVSTGSTANVSTSKLHPQFFHHENIKWLCFHLFSHHKFCHAFTMLSVKHSNKKQSIVHRLVNLLVVSTYLLTHAEWVVCLLHSYLLLFFYILVSRMVISIVFLFQHHIQWKEPGKPSYTHTNTHMYLFHFPCSFLLL